MGNEANEKVTGSNKGSSHVLIKGFKNLLLSGIIYFIGYMNWSVVWIIIPLIYDVYKGERKKKSINRRNLVREAALGNEKKIILENVEDLPSWVYFPDIERAEWVNRILKQFWPNVNHYARDFIINTTQGVLRKKLEKYSLKGFTYQRVILGNVPFRIGGIIVYDNVARDEIVMDVDVSYAGDCDIKFRLRGLNGGIKNFQLYGRLRVVLKPLINSMPLVGGLQAFFLTNPEIEFDLDGIAGILETPGINDLLKKSIVDTVSSLMVLPNKFPIKFNKDVSAAQLKTPTVAGVLRVHVVEAKDLMKMDIGFTGKGKSDPYTLLEVEDQCCRTETIDNTVNPKWDYWCEFIILEFSGQQLNINVWDQDATNDEFLGRVSLDISNLIKMESKDLWLNLEDVKHGKIHVRWMWLSLSTDYLHLQAAIYEVQQLQIAHLNTALLVVFLDSAINLPQEKKLSHKPDPYVQLQVGRQIKSTKAVDRTINPVWEEGFIFFVNNPDSDFLDLSVMDGKTEKELCALRYNISNLSNKENLEIVEQPFRFDNVTLDSTIVWSLHLKIFKNENAEDHIEDFINTRRRSSASSPSKTNLEGKLLDGSLTGNHRQEDVFDRLSKSTRSSMMSTSSRSKRRSKSRLSEDLASVGKIKLTLRYSQQRQVLVVVVHSLADIPQKSQGERDLYVKLYLLPERNKYTKRKTSVKNSNDPVFDLQFEYVISQGELSSKELEISVIEEKAVRNFVLGRVIIDLANLEIPSTHTSWFDLEPHLKKD